MAILTRQPQKVFAGAAAADQLAVFGTMKTGTPVYSSDLATLQSTAYTEGWDEAILEDKAPYLEEMNAVQYGLSYQIAYLLQEGIPAYDANTNYSATSLVKVISGNNLLLYRSLSDNNIGHALSETTYWAEVYLNTTNRIGDPVMSLSDTKPANTVWLEGSTVSRTTYANLFAIYGTTYGSGDGSTTFKLPDFRNRAIWGASSFGYLSAGLPNITGSATGKEWPHYGSGTGAFTCTTGSNKSAATGSNEAIILNFNASRSNSIYGNSTTVQPPAIKVRVYTRYK